MQTPISYSPVARLAHSALLPALLVLAVPACTTIPHLQAEAELSYSQMVLDMQPEPVQPFLEGRRLFHTDFATGEHGDPGNPALGEQAGKLGPLFNVTSCSVCHEHNGRGEPPAVGEPLTSMAVKLYGDDPQVQRGQQVFESTGCVGCHLQETFTADVHPLVELRDQTIRPFSDLLLHDMGEGLADPQGGPLAQERRTAPL